MIDIHTHILYGLDDGPESLEESIEMCRMASGDGVRIMVATPHTLNGVYTNDRAAILNRVRELNRALFECGIRNAEFGMGNRSSSTKALDSVSCPLPAASSDSELRTPNSELVDFAIRNPQSGSSCSPDLCPLSSDVWKSQSAIRNPQSAITGLGADPSSIVHRSSSIGFQVLPGADVSFSPDVVERFEKGEVETLNDKGRHILFEFPSQGIPYGAEEVLFQFMARGIVPIITHPERNLEIARKPDRYYEMIRRGCLGQVTAMSLTGGFGSGVRRVAEKLLASRLVHIIASDAHSVNWRPPILSTAVKAAGRIVGKEEARKMVTDYPEAVLDGRRPSVPDPKPIDKG